MAAKTRRLLTNFSKGELSPLLEGRPDLAAYFEGAKTLENVLLMRQGGVTRRPGLRFIAEVKDSSKDTILLPFEASVDAAYIVEAGHLYLRFYRNQARLHTSAGGPAVEVATPYTESDLRSLHMTQSVDVAYLFHPDYAQRRLARAADTDWTLAAITYTPPPSFEADTDIGTGASAGADATLTPASTTGTSVLFTASQPVFLEADVGRQIIAGTARAVITAFGASAGDTTSPNDHVRADILDAFPGSAGGGDPIAAGDWLLRLSPQTTLDPTIAGPLGAAVALVAGANAFRAADVGKYLKVYGGVVRITIVDSATQVRGEIEGVMSETADANPAAAPAGAWTLEVPSWSATQGFPRTGEFFQGRLFQAATAAQPTTFWGSVSDDFENYAVGALADAAIEFTIASRQLNRIEWLADNLDLFLGTSGSEHQATGATPDTPLGGDVVPLVRRLTRHGSAPVQPLVLNRRTLWLDRSRRKLLSLGFSWEEDGFDAVELTAAAEHITEGGLALGPMAFATRPDPRLYAVRADGQLVTLTLHYQERVVGFTRLVTDGAFEAVAVIPQAGGGADEVWVIVRRTVNGATKRFVERFDPEPIGTRAWGLETDSAVVYVGAATTTITGLDHLEGLTVAAVAGGSYVGTFVVSGGAITLPEAATEVEVGLPYTSTIETMRPAVEGQVLEGLPRSWDSLFVRLHETMGGAITGEPIQYAADALDTRGLFTGDRKVTGQGWSTDGRITVTQDQPYPLTLLAAFGTLAVGDHD